MAIMTVYILAFLDAPPPAVSSKRVDFFRKQKEIHINTITRL